MTFLFAMIVINCVMSILIDLYSGLRSEHQEQVADAPPEEAMYSVNNLPLLCTYVCVCSKKWQLLDSASCMVQSWGNLPARRIQDVPSQLLPLLAYAQQQQALSKQSVYLHGKSQEADAEHESTLSACKRVLQGIKYTFALLWYFFRPSQAQREQVLAAGDQTRYISIAKLLLETREHLSESFRMDDEEQLKGWCVDVPVPQQHHSKVTSESHEKDSDDQETVGRQMNAAALYEALLWARYSFVNLYTLWCKFV